MIRTREGNRMKRFLFGVIAVWASATYVSAAPEPAIVPTPGHWTLDVQFTHPQQIVVGRGSDNQPARFWYIILTITNDTGQDVSFHPKCDLMTDTFQIVPAGKFVSPAVFERIRKRYEKTYPFLESLDQVGSKILQGEDNAKDIAIIWPDFGVQARKIKIFITGLSNETAVVDFPVATDAGEPAKVYLRKTLELSYDLRGDPAIRSSVSLVYKGKRWVMR
jgi:hypothetical protein